MAEKQKFFNQKIDRTPTGSCYLLTIVIIVFYILVARLLWNTGEYIKEGHWKAFFGSSSKISTPKVNNNLIEESLNKAKDAATNAADSATEQIKDKATETIKDTAADAAKDATETIKASTQNIIDNTATQLP